MFDLEEMEPSRREWWLKRLAKQFKAEEAAMKAAVKKK